MDFPRIPGESHADHIGDGVYATWNGYAVVLRTPRDGRWEEMHFDPETWNTLQRWKQRVNFDAANKAAAESSVTE